MVEPITVRVEKIKGSSRSPIPLPSTEGSERPPGTDWTKDDVRGIEEFLVTRWTGGGLYEVTATDSSVPPLVMKWHPSWDIKQYPELVPEPLREAAKPTSDTTTQQPAQPSNHGRTPMAFPNGFPQVTPMLAAQQPQQHQHPQQGYYPQQGYQQMPSPPPIGTHAWTAWSAEADKRKHDEELKALRDQAATRQREADETRHKAELDRIRIESEAKSAAQQRAFETKFEAMQASINTLMSKLGEAQKPAVNAEVEAMREHTRKLEEKLENDRRERDAEKRDRDTRDMMAKMMETANARADTLQRMFEAQMQAMRDQVTSNNNRPDQMAPFIALMNEQARQHNDSLKEIARTNKESVSSLQTFMMNPRDMAALVQEQSRNADTATERVTNLFGRVVEMQQKATENLLQMQPGGSGVIDVVRDGVSSLKEVAEKFVGARGASERMAMQSQKDVAEAQARAIEAQANAEMFKANPAAFTPPPPRQEAQLSGPAVEQTPPPMFAPKRKKAAAVEAVPDVKRMGRTDEQWFTMAMMPEVETLREGVAYFLESCRQDPPRVDAATGEIEGIQPIQTAMGIAQAAQMAMQQNANIPAMIELLFQERFADFMDLLLPAATQAYRDETVQELIKLLEKLSGEAPNPKPAEASDEAPDDDDGDDDDDDEVVEAQAPAKPVPVIVPVRRGPGRPPKNGQIRTT